jgi:hypothetical protein
MRGPYARSTTRRSVRSDSVLPRDRPECRDRSPARRELFFDFLRDRRSPESLPLRPRRAWIIARSNNASDPVGWISERKRSGPAGDRPMNSGHFHHARSHLRVGKRRPAKLKSLGAKFAFPRYGDSRFGNVRIEWKIWMLNWVKSSGVDAPRNKITFLAPRPSGVFYG